MRARAGTVAYWKRQGRLLIARLRASGVEHAKSHGLVDATAERPNGEVQTVCTVLYRTSLEQALRLRSSLLLCMANAEATACVLMKRVPCACDTVSEMFGAWHMFHSAKGRPLLIVPSTPTTRLTRVLRGQAGKLRVTFPCLAMPCLACVSGAHCAVPRRPGRRR